MSRLAGWAPFAWGFRPFFLLAGLCAAAAILVWLLVYTNGAAPFGALAPSLWHAHEMLYGFVGAAVAGFLLTAVANWTGTRSISGTPLALLTLAWIAGRVAMSLFAFLPVIAVCLIALAFVPAVFLAVLRPLLDADDRRLPLLALLLAYWLSDVAFLYGVLAGLPGVARSALGAGVGIVLLLVSIIGGRIVPVFTANALRKRGIDVTVPATPGLDRLVVLSMLEYVIADLARPGSSAMAAVAAAAGVLQLLRFLQWHGHRTWKEPIVWVLHVAYAALPLGLLLRALYHWTGAGWAMHWQHLLTMGAAATMILAVMSRAALGHTGRPLRVAGVIGVAYASLVAATVTRVFGPALLPYMTSVVISGGLWIFAFSVYSVVYAPILTRARIDGKPG